MLFVTIFGLIKRHRRFIVSMIEWRLFRKVFCERTFYNGISKPVNSELADIMLKLRFMEQSGKGKQSASDAR